MEEQDVKIKSIADAIKAVDDIKTYEDFDVDDLIIENAKLLLGIFDQNQYPDIILPTLRNTIQFEWDIIVCGYQYYLEMEIMKTTIHCLFMKGPNYNKIDVNVPYAKILADFETTLTKTLVVRNSDLSPDFNDDVCVSVKGILNVFYYFR